MKNNIFDLVLPEAGQQFKAEDFRQLIGPGVYVFLCNGVPVYVGMSNDNLLGRAAGNRHHKAIARNECDEVRLFPCKTSAAARELETYLINKCRPKYNETKIVSELSRLLGTNGTPSTISAQYGAQVLKS